MKMFCTKKAQIKMLLLVSRAGIARSHLSTVADLHNQSALRKMALPSQEFTVNKKHIQCKIYNVLL